jgi:hypothetical protein
VDEYATKKRPSTLIESITKQGPNPRKYIKILECLVCPSIRLQKGKAEDKASRYHKRFFFFFCRTFPNTTNQVQSNQPIGLMLEAPVSLVNSSQTRPLSRL